MDEVAILVGLTEVVHDDTTAMAGGKDNATTLMITTIKINCKAKRHCLSITLSIVPLSKLGNDSTKHRHTSFYTNLPGNLIDPHYLDPIHDRRIYFLVRRNIFLPTEI